MRRTVIALAISNGLFALPALAADHAVAVGGGGFFYVPSTLTIAVGDTVTFTNAGGFHNVVSDDDAVTAFRCAAGCDETGGNGDPSNASWSATVSFPTAGTIGYYCEVHGASGGVGMAGTIIVEPAATTPGLDVSPGSLAGEAEAGASTTIAFDIGNSGTATLDWTADTASGDCASPVAVPWIVLAPAAGSVGAGAPATSVDVTLDAAALTPGAYNANICIHSNDAAHDPLALPVAFTVTIPDLIFANGFDG